MCFEVCAQGIEIKLQINGYVKPSYDNWDAEWCNCDFSFISGNWLCYCRETSEVLLSREVVELEELLTKLLNNELSEKEEFCCIEPDFKFTLYPYGHDELSPGLSLSEDVCLDWYVFFWHRGLTKNYLAVRLNRSNIIKLKEYLSSVIKNKS